MTFDEWKAAHGYKHYLDTSDEERAAQVGWEAALQFARPEAEAFEAACWRLALINNMIRDGVDGISLIVSEVSKPQNGEG